MSTISFKEIRQRYPNDFLVLLDFDEEELPSGQIQVTGADEVRAFDSGSEMYDTYRELKRQGRKVLFCTPNYRQSFVIEKVASARLFT